MTETATIYKGDTGGPWLVGHMLDDGTLATLGGSYSCSIKVAGTGIDRAVTDQTGDIKRFIAALNPSETETLSAGQYVVAIEISNPALIPPLRTETHVILTVEEQIVGSSYVPAAETDIERLTREIAAVKAQRVNLATGGAVAQLWRDGRRVEYKIASMSELNDLVRMLESELAAAQVAAGITPTNRRRAIGLAWRN